MDWERKKYSLHKNSLVHSWHCMMAFFSVRCENSRLWPCCIPGNPRVLQIIFGDRQRPEGNTLLLLWKPKQIEDIRCRIPWHHRYAPTTYIYVCVCIYVLTTNLPLSLYVYTWHPFNSYVMSRKNKTLIVYLEKKIINLLWDLNQFFLVSDFNSDVELTDMGSEIHIYLENLNVYIQNMLFTYT